MVAHYLLNDDDLLRACRVERVSAGGPGGQHANKNACAVRLQIAAFGVTVQCQDFRSLEANTKRALRELRIRLAMHERGHGLETSLDRFRNGTKLRISEDNAQFASVVGFLLDHLSDANYEVKIVAESLGISSSQIIKCLQLHKAVWHMVLEQRALRGLSLLK